MVKLILLWHKFAFEALSMIACCILVGPSEASRRRLARHSLLREQIRHITFDKGPRHGVSEIVLLFILFVHILFFLFHFSHIKKIKNMLFYFMVFGCLTNFDSRLLPSETRLRSSSRSPRNWMEWLRGVKHFEGKTMESKKHP